MSCPQGLGDGEYMVSIRSRGGANLVTEVPAEKIEWDRRLDEISEATVTVALPDPRNPCSLVTGILDTCELAAGLRTWAMEVHIARDGSTVWEGPIVRLVYGRSVLIITARDVLAWAGRRTIHSLIDFRSPAGPADLSRIAEALIIDAYTPDDPRVLRYLTVIEAGVFGERFYGDKPRYALDELRELARTGVDFTVIGRRIVISGELGLTRLSALGQDDFLGEIRIIEDGNGAATEGWVVGKGVVGNCGGTDDYFGLLEVIATQDSILDEPSADAQACAIVATGNPPPTYVEMPSSAQLACDARVCIEELVPGVIIPLVLADDVLCRALVTDLRLRTVSVSVDARGESVGVELTPVGEGGEI